MNFKHFWNIKNIAKPMTIADIPSPRNLTIAGIIAAIYVALTLINPMSFGNVQFRVSEALTVLPILLPQAVPGLFIGVVISNLFSPAGLIDVVVGSLATLIAAILTYRYRRNILAAMLSPVVINGLLIGAMLHFALQFPLLPTIVSVAFGELLVVFILGSLLLKSLDRFDLQNR